MRTERPISFSAPMVHAILEGQKTVTRRPVMGEQIPHLEYPEQPESWAAVGQHHPRYGFLVYGKTEGECAAKLGQFGACPYGQRGDHLWVRESWTADAQVDAIAPRDLSRGEPIYYPADGSLRQTGCSMITLGKRRPPSQMPRWASRIILEITRVRVERLQDISRTDIRAEGLQCPPELASDDASPNYRDWFPAAFRELWESAGRDWDANPWVWVAEFRRITP